MPTLASDLRRQLENVVIQARDVAEVAARSALQKRGVDVAAPFAHFGLKEKDQRNRLRARGRQVGDVRNPDNTQSIDQLTQELAYEYWHRMLFARFLAENHLLMHPDGVAVSLEECEELAPAEKAPNGHPLPAVTQLFTEHYMVEFLLHNTIGAWWCGRQGIKGPAGGAGLPGHGM